MSTISAEAQIRYLLQWFQEWSDLQRSDFLPVLAENYAHKAYVNGIVNSIANINCRDKPMSIFECRIKLFKEWFIQWNIEQKEAFLKKLGDIDPHFMEKLNLEIDSTHTDDSNTLNN
ncbi:uncharacterized protein C14orf119 [Rhynchophorus ferrugineus]|uniref:Uncharacterized protein n=1 Tax=Rhynchophorus ferrugineus TaxID=354439 RepID=A0A834ING7_RHYFE|nr:hypothetical protein GWI33_001490 [Rhynchophorus ferrugineus]